MNVKLNSYSQPHKPTFLDWKTAGTPDDLTNIQDLVVYCARVSNPSNQMNLQTGGKLIDYLIANSHWSPFQMVNVCLEVHTTRDITRQILRHSSFAFQEFSQRYANPINDLDFAEPKQARLQDKTNRQNSIEIDLDDFAQVELNQQWIAKQQQVIDLAKEHYTWAIQNGIAKEVARVILPEGLTNSVILVNGSLRSWIHYIQVRTHKGTQKEHIDIARACAQVITEIFPHGTKIFNAN